MKTIYYKLQGPPDIGCSRKDFHGLPMERFLSAISLALVARDRPLVDSGITIYTLTRVARS